MSTDTYKCDAERCDYAKLVIDPSNYNNKIIINRWKCSGLALDPPNIDDKIIINRLNRSGKFGRRSCNHYRKIKKKTTTTQTQTKLALDPAKTTTTQTQTKLALDPANYEMCAKEMLEMLRHFVK